MTPNVRLEALSSLLAHDPEAGRLNTRHLQLIAALCDARGYMTASEAAAAIRLSPSQTARLIGRLEDRGLVSRWVRFDDQRCHMIAPTRAGRALNDRVRGHVIACLV